MKTPPVVSPVALNLIQRMDEHLGIPPLCAASLYLNPAWRAEWSAIQSDLAKVEAGKAWEASRSEKQCHYNQCHYETTAQPAPRPGFFASALAAFAPSAPRWQQGLLLAAMVAAGVYLCWPGLLAVWEMMQ